VKGNADKPQEGADGAVAAAESPRAGRKRLIAGVLAAVGVYAAISFAWSLQGVWLARMSVNRDDDPLTLLEVQRIVGDGDLSMIERVYYHPDRSKVQRKMRTFGDDLLAD